MWPDWLRKIDTLLEDDAVIEVVAQALERRWPQSRRRGRLGTPAEVVIRLLILKHLFDWSYDDIEREVLANLVYRMLTRIDACDVPDAKTILKIARALGSDVIEQLHRQVVEVAKRAGVTHGRRFRIDTTVVETNAHYPTGSMLLRDGVRVLTRTMQRASTALGDPAGRLRNRLRNDRVVPMSLNTWRRQHGPWLVAHVSALDGIGRWQALRVVPVVIRRSSCVVRDRFSGSRPPAPRPTISRERHSIIRATIARAADGCSGLTQSQPKSLVGASFEKQIHLHHARVVVRVRLDESVL
jgi:hypothetical protein